MATQLAVTLKDLLEHHGLSEESLNQEVARDDIHEISTFLTDDWRLLACVPKINLTYNEIEVIRKDNDGEDLKKLAFLIKWKKKQSIKATYRVLVDALLSNENSNDASKVCQLVKSK